MKKYVLFIFLSSTQLFAADLKHGLFVETKMNLGTEINQNLIEYSFILPDVGGPDWNSLVTKNGITVLGRFKKLPNDMLSTELLVADSRTEPHGSLQSTKTVTKIDESNSLIFNGESERIDLSIRVSKTTFKN